MTSVWIEMVTHVHLTGIFMKMVKGQTNQEISCLQEWCDYRLRWDQPPRSALYGNIKSQLRVPSQNIWLPDIILENK